MSGKRAHTTEVVFPEAVSRRGDVTMAALERQITNCSWERFPDLVSKPESSMNLNGARNHDSISDSCYRGYFFLKRSHKMVSLPHEVIPPETGCLSRTLEH